MTDKQTYSWIFFSIALGSQKEAIGYNDISNLADGINHAVPTDNEMRKSINWLISENLISKTGKKYQLTDLGKDIYKSVEVNNKSTLNTWKELENKI